MKVIPKEPHVSWRGREIHFDMIITPIRQAIYHSLHWSTKSHRSWISRRHDFDMDINSTSTSSWANLPKDKTQHWRFNNFSGNVDVIILTTLSWDKQSWMLFFLPSLHNQNEQSISFYLRLLNNTNKTDGYSVTRECENTWDWVNHVSNWIVSCWIQDTYWWRRIPTVAE